MASTKAKVGLPVVLVADDGPDVCIIVRRSLSGWLPGWTVAVIRRTFHPTLGEIYGSLNIRRSP